MWNMYLDINRRRWEESERRRAEERRSEKRKSEKKEDAGARKGRKVAIHCVFQWLVAAEGRKVGSLKRRVRSHLGRWEMKNCTPLWREAHLQVKKLKTSHVRRLLEVEMSKKRTLLWREAHFQVKMYKAHQLWNTFWSWHVGKVRAVLARSTFRSQNVQSTSVSDRFRVGWKAGGDQGAVRKPSEEAVVTCPSISGFGVNSPGLKPSSSCCGQVRLDLSLAPRNKVPAGRPGILLHLPNWM